MRKKLKNFSSDKTKKNHILTKLKNSSHEQTHFLTKGLLVRKLKTSTTGEMYPGQLFAILQCFFSLHIFVFDFLSLSSNVHLCVCSLCVPLFAKKFLRLIIPIYKGWKSNRPIERDSVGIFYLRTLVSDLAILAWKWLKIATQGENWFLVLATYCWCI